MKDENNSSSATNFQQIDLNDLPKYSEWPNRLIGLSDWPQKNRNDELILREYGEKWENLLRLYEQHQFNSLSETIKFFLHNHFPSNFLFHIGEQIYNTENTDFFWNFYYSEIKKVIGKYIGHDTTLVELGCGWGRNLFYALQMKWCNIAIGGEYTEQGIMLGNQIKNKLDLPINFFHFDYYNVNIKQQKFENAVFFTHNSIEQIRFIPEKSILNLIRCKPRVVIHLEPIYEHRNNKTFLHCLWKKYTELNDYNRNFLTILKKFEKQEQLRIILEKPIALGLNAFNPCSFIIWEPVN